jgi:hypothetical protein
MSIDVHSERLYDLSQAAAFFPSGINPQTMRRYIRQKKLDAVLVVGKYMTSKEAVFRYLDKLAKGEI